jgi:long-subunit fatty acid transport protein
MRSLAVLGTLAGSLLAAGAALAEGGYFSGTLGARAGGRAGAFAAKADDLSAVYHNPAGLANLEGTLVEVGNQTSYNAYSFTRAPTVDWGHPTEPNGTIFPNVTFAKVSNGKPWQGIVPMLGAASKLGLKDWAFALAVYAPPGVGNLSFPLAPYDAANPPDLSRPQPDGQRYMMVDREAIFLKYVASAAWKYGELFGLGASAEWIHVPRLKYSLVVDATPFAYAANPVYADLDMLATMQASSLFTFNAILGAWYRPVPSLVFALSGQVVPADIVLHGNLSVEPLNQNMGEVTLWRNNARASDVKVKLPLPMLARAAVRYRNLVNNRERFDVELDVEYVTWSRVGRWTIDTMVDGKVLEARYQSERMPISPIAIEKHWRDTFAVRLGGEYAVIPGRLGLRAGGYYETAVANPAYAAVDFPGAAQFGGALGASVFVRRFEVAVAYALKLMPSMTVAEAEARGYQQVPASACPAPYTDPDYCNPNLNGAPAPVVNAGTYTAFSHFLYLGVLYRYGL